MAARFLLSSLGTAGDVLPYVGVGAMLRARGHEVVLLANERFRPEAEAADLAFEPVGTLEEYGRFVATPDLWDPHRCIEVGFDALIRPQMARGLEAVSRHYVPGHTVLMCSSFVFYGRIAGECLGIPLVSSTLQPCSLFRDDVPARAPGERWLGRLAGPRGRALHRRRRGRRMDDMLSWVNDCRRENGLSPIRDIFHDWRYSRQGVVGLWPPLFFGGRTTCPVEPEQVGFVFHESRTAPETDWRKSLEALGGERPLVFTLGTGMVQGAAFFETAAAACRRLGHPALFVAGDGSQLPGELPPNVRHVAHAPFSELLPHAELLVHHGGIGSFARALLSATPQILVPMAFDQFDNAFLAGHLGVGTGIPFAELDVDALVRAIDAIRRDDAVRARCQSWSAALAAHEVEPAVCRALEARVGLDAKER